MKFCSFLTNDVRSSDLVNNEEMREVWAEGTRPQILRLGSEAGEMGKFWEL